MTRTIGAGDGSPCTCFAQVLKFFTHETRKQKWRAACAFTQQARATLSSFPGAFQPVCLRVEVPWISAPHHFLGFLTTTPEFHIPQKYSLNFEISKSSGHQAPRKVLGKCFSRGYFSHNARFDKARGHFVKPQYFQMVSECQNLICSVSSALFFLICSLTK